VDVNCFTLRPTARLRPEPVRTRRSPTRGADDRTHQEGQR
jgi:hypothetical protein